MASPQHLSILKAVAGRRVALPLDEVPGAAGAWATHRLRSGYTGSCLRVRRDSDNAELDIGFGIGGKLDSAALAAFVGAGSGYVRTWYDQSGNGIDAVQATEARQPTIVDSGNVLGFLRFNTSPCFLAMPSSSLNPGTGDWSTVLDILIPEIGANMETFVSGDWFNENGPYYLLQSRPDISGRPFRVLVSSTGWTTQWAWRDSASSVPIGEYFVLAGTWRNSNDEIIIYLNAEDISGSYGARNSVGNVNPTVDSWIGAGVNTAGVFYQATMDAHCVCIYTRKLAPGEVGTISSILPKRR